MKIGLNEIYNGIIPKRLDYNILINGIRNIFYADCT